MRMMLCFCLILSSQAGMSQVVSALGGVAELMRPNDPVSIVFERKSVHTLEGGTVVTTVSHQWFYRDSKGRVRIEDEIGNLAGSNSISTHTVHVNDPLTLEVTLWSTGPRAEHTYERFHARMPAPMEPLPPVGSNTEIPRNPPGIRPDDPKVPHTERKAMGEDSIKGAKCESLQSTTTYTAGAFGNDRMVTVVSENCVSKEFGMPIRISHDDPRTGRQTLDITSLQRNEPDESLFRPPDAYIERQSRRQAAPSVP